jgi:VWFA-related protein
VHIEPWVKLACRSAQKAGRFALKYTRHSLGRVTGIACLRVISLIVFSALYFAPLLSWLNPVTAQTGAIGGAVEPVSQPSENPNPQGVIRITVDLVQVDAIVTDSNGRHVTNLRPEDFTILEDGHPQTITNFSFIPTAQPAGTEAHAATLPAATGMPEVPPVRLAPEQVRRSIVILVDDLHIAFANMYYVRRALTKFIDDEVQPGDLVAILHTSGGLGVRQQFTNDKHVLHANVDRLRYYILYDPEGEPELLRYITTIGALDALKYVLGGLRDLPGRKAIFLVSDGLQFCTSEDRNCTGEIVERRLREVADLANRCAAVLHTIDSQGLPTLSLDATVDLPQTNANPQWILQTQDMKYAAYWASLGPMAFLAQQTEGLFLHDNNDLAGGMHEMMDDLSGYYLIGYKPAASTFKDDRGGRGYHHIEVKVKGHGLHVRTRPGFYGIPDHPGRPVYRTRQDQLMAAIVSPFTTSGVRVQLAPQFLRKGDKDLVARLWLHIDARDLTFQDVPGGNKNGAANLVAVAFGDNGAIESGVGNTLRGSLQPSEFEAGRERGMNSRIDLPIKKPGGYQVRVAVGDAGSQRLGSASQFIEIRDLRSGRLALSGIVLNPKVLGESGPAVRRFKAGDRVSYELEIYNARAGNNVRSLSLETRIQLFHDGRLVSEQNPGAVSEVPEDSNRLVMSGEFALARDTAPGDYVLLVTVTDNLASPRRNAARQWIDFEVVP